MNTVKKVAKNTSVVIVWSIANKIIALLIAIYLARYLGVAGYGDYSFIFAYTSFFGIIVDLGINTVLVREIAKNKERTEELISNAVGLKLALFALAALFSFLVLSFLTYPEEVKIGIYIATFILLFSSIASLLGTVFQANLQMEYIAIADLISKLPLLLLIIYISSQKGGSIRVIIATLGATILYCVLMYLFSKRVVAARVKFNVKIWKEILNPAILLGLSGVLSSIFVRMDLILVSLIRGNLEVGYYSIPSQLTDSLTIVPLAFMSSLFPLMSNYSKVSKQSLAKSFRLAIKYMLILSIPMAFGTTLLSDRIIIAIYSTNFIPSSPALIIMAWGTILVFCDIIFDNMLISTNQQKKSFIAVGLTALFSVIGNLILIPQMGFIGASIVLLASNILITLIYLHFLSPLLKVLDGGSVIKSVLASLVMLLFIKYSTLNVYLLIPVSASIYFICLVIFGGISKEDIEILKSLKS